MEISIVNGFIIEANIDGSFAIYENEEVEYPIKVAKNATEMIRFCNTH